MCDTCGCNITPGNVESARKPASGATAVSVLKSLLAGNDEQAAQQPQQAGRPPNAR